MKTLIIYTGGTIGMVNDTLSGSLIPGKVEGVETFLKQHKLMEFCDVLAVKNPVDSSDFNKAYYTELSNLIKNNYKGYSSFLILMGTDTMAYISSLLSFCISGLSKSILFTGGQKSLYENQSDSVVNLTEAITGLVKDEFPREVGVYFSKKWHRAVCVTKYHSFDFDAYISVYNKEYNPSFNNQFEIITKLSSDVAVLKITPFGIEKSFLALLQEEKLDVIVLEVFGSGNIPKLSTTLESKIKERMKGGLVVVVSTQCMYGGMELGRYDSSLNISSLGFLNGGNKTTEAIVAKILYLLEKKLNIQELGLNFDISLRGE